MSAKQLFAPLPLRAMAMDLSGLQLRVLMCVAAHDRMSLVTGKGQGCRASNSRMADMIGCSYAKLCAALSSLADAEGDYGLLDREQVGRHTVYRVIYSDDDRCLFGNLSASGRVTEQASDGPRHVTGQSQKSAENCEIPPHNIFRETGGINYEESCEINSVETARLASRRHSYPIEGLADREPGEVLARADRAIRDPAVTADELDAAERDVGRIMDAFGGYDPDDPTGSMAERVHAGIEAARERLAACGWVRRVSRELAENPGPCDGPDWIEALEQFRAIAASAGTPASTQFLAQSAIVEIERRMALPAKRARRRS